MAETKKPRARDFLFLHAILIVYSLASVCSKLAAGYDFLSQGFILYYGLVLVILAVYALLWQQVLKRMPLTVAFANKAVVIIWGIIWGIFLFGETLRPAMIAGALIIVLGIYLVVTDDE